MADEPPTFRESTGKFSVDYRDHDGTVVLGQGDWRFITKWSTAGNGTIHAYRDSGSRVAVAPNVSSIEQVNAEIFAQANFSSRARTPRVGEVALWLNDKGFAAAVELQKVTVTSESQSGTVLEARYRILTDGTRDFSDDSSPELLILEQRLRECLEAFNQLPDVDTGDLSPSGPGIGHNQPPPELALTRADFADTLVDLQSPVRELRSESRLRRVYESALKIAAKIRSAIAWRLQLIEEGFYRQIGASIAISLGMWLIVSGKFDQLAEAALAVGKALLAW